MLSFSSYPVRVTPETKGPMAINIARRRFVAALGGAAVAWPFAVRAQQSSMPVIGWLNSGSAGNPFFANLVLAFRKGLTEAGFVEGQNIAIDFRWAEGQYDRLPALAAELVGKKVAVIFAGGPPAALAAKAATNSIPIVFGTGDDPVRVGLVASFNRPGGNATGINVLLEALETKRLGLLHDVVPRATTIAVLLNAKSPSFETQSNEIQGAARAAGLKVHILTADTERDIDKAFATFGQLRIGALMVGADPSLNSRREQLVTLAARQSLPTMFSLRDAAVIGGLISYSIDFPDAYRQMAGYVGRILKGEKPADLPVESVSKFELIINLKTAKALGLTIPPGVLAIADEVIE
jgi:putative ABC transport system substrate-binding protein